jgi:hypothetical protein
MKQNKVAMHKSSEVLSRKRNTGRLKKKIIEELDHLEDSENTINNQQHLKKKNDSEEKHHSKDPLHPGIKLFFLVYVILVTILDTKLQTIEPMPRIEETMKAIKTIVILEIHMKHITKITIVLVH